MALRRLQAHTGVVSRSLCHPLTSAPDVWLLSSSACSPASQQRRAASSSSKPPAAPFPIFTNIKDYRKWRRHVQRSAILSSSSSSSSSSQSSWAEASPAELAAEEEASAVGFVPTMGALHAGHLDLVRRSLRENRHTVVSIFVNPAQFAPTEDLASYPRTLESDIASLVGLEKEVELASSQGSSSTARGSHLDPQSGKISAIFCPDVREMYPPLPGTQTPFTQNVSQQQGAFIEVQGLSSVLEGKSRPGFFRGVATVVTKLWHIVEVSRTSARTLQCQLYMSHPLRHASLCLLTPLPANPCLLRPKGHPASHHPPCPPHLSPLPITLLLNTNRHLPSDPHHTRRANRPSPLKSECLPKSSRVALGIHFVPGAERREGLF